MSKMQKSKERRVRDCSEAKFSEIEGFLRLRMKSQPQKSLRSLLLDIYRMSCDFGVKSLANRDCNLRFSPKSRKGSFWLHNVLLFGLCYGKLPERFAMAVLVRLDLRCCLGLLTRNDALVGITLPLAQASLAAPWRQWMLETMLSETTSILSVSERALRSMMKC